MIKNNKPNIINKIKFKTQPPITIHEPIADNFNQPLRSLNFIFCFSCVILLIKKGNKFPMVLDQGGKTLHLYLVTEVYKVCYYLFMIILLEKVYQINI